MFPDGLTAKKPAPSRPTIPDIEKAAGATPSDPDRTAPGRRLPAEKGRPGKDRLQEGQRASLENLHASEQKYRAVFESIDEGFCTLEVLFDGQGKAVDYRFLETNPAFERQTGLANAAGKTIRELAPEHEEFWFETYGRIARTGEAIRFEHEAAALGRFFDVYAFRIGEPEANRVAVLFNDIFPRRRAETALRESEERFRLFVTAASDMVYRMNADWSEMIWLDGKKLLADTRDPSLTWLEEYIPESDKALVEAAVGEAVRTGTAFGLEHGVIRADGSLGWVSSRAIPMFGRGGEIVEWFGAATDATDRKRIEKNLAFLADVSQDLVRLTNVAETMETFGAKIAAHFAASIIAFAEVDENQEVVRIDHGWRRTDWSSLRGLYRLRDFHSEEFRRASRAGEIYVVGDVATDERVKAAPLAALGIAAFVSVPLLRDGRWCFQLTVYDSAPRSWRRDEIALMQELTTRIWTRLERVRAEEALRESEARRHLALDAAGMGTFVWHPQEDRGEPDARMLELFGLGEGDLMNLKNVLGKVIHPDDFTRFAAAIAKATEPDGDGKLAEEIRILHRDQSLHWIVIHAQTIFGGTEPPRATRMYGIASEITEQKRRAANQQLIIDLDQRLSVLRQPEAIEQTVVDVLGRHLRGSRCYIAHIDKKMARVEREYRQAGAGISMVGQHRIADFLAPDAFELHGADPTFTVADVFANEQTADRANAYVAFGVRAYATASVFYQGELIASVGVTDARKRVWREDELELLRDVATRVYPMMERARAENALRASEARQAFLLKFSDALRPLAKTLAIQAVAMQKLGQHLDADRALYIEVLPDGDTLRSGPSYLRGVPPIPSLMRLDDFGGHNAAGYRQGRTIVIHDVLEDERYTPEQLGAFAAVQVQAAIGVPLVKEGRLVAIMCVHQATPRFFGTAEVALVEEVGQRTWAAVERARAEEALRESDAQLRLADQRRSEFLAMLGHELRNPLAAVDGGLKLLLSPRARAESREATLPIVAHQVAHMKRLIDDVLDLARLERGKLQVKLVEVDLDRTLRTAIHMIENLAEAKGSEIRYAPPDGPLELLADPERLVQVFANLLTNALKFSTPGSPVDLWVERGKTMVVRVRDYGRGIAAENLGEIFEPFVQSKFSLGIPEGGLGLGLSISRELVELQGGRIIARSAGLNQGSTFEVTLPLPTPPS